MTKAIRLKQIISTYIFRTPTTQTRVQKCNTKVSSSRIRTRKPRRIVEDLCANRNNVIYATYGALWGVMICAPSVRCGVRWAANQRRENKYIREPEVWRWKITLYVCLYITWRNSESCLTVYFGVVVGFS